MDSENPTFKSDFHFAIFLSRHLFLFFFFIDFFCLMRSRPDPFQPRDHKIYKRKRSIKSRDHEMNRFNPHGRTEDKRMSSALYFMIRLRVDFQCCVFRPTRNTYGVLRTRTFVHWHVLSIRTWTYVKKKKKLVKKCAPLLFYDFKLKSCTNQSSIFGHVREVSSISQKNHHFFLSYFSYTRVADSKWSFVFTSGRLRLCAYGCITCSSYFRCLVKLPSYFRCLTVKLPKDCFKHKVVF